MSWKSLCDRLTCLPSLSWAFLARPAEAWRDLGPPAAAWYAPLLAHVLPLALMPAIGWNVGKAIFPLTGPAAGRLASNGHDPSIYSGLLAGIAGTVLMCLLSVVLLAVAIHCLAPLYRLRRDWARAVEVAAYANTPVLLAGLFMFWPVLILVSVVAIFPFCRVVYVGLQTRMGCRAADAPACAAMAMLLAILMSMILGAVGGALDII